MNGWKAGTGVVRIVCTDVCGCGRQRLIVETVPPLNMWLTIIGLIILIRSPNRWLIADVSVIVLRSSRIIIFEKV